MNEAIIGKIREIREKRAHTHTHTRPLSLSSPLLSQSFTLSTPHADQDAVSVRRSGNVCSIIHARRGAARCGAEIFIQMNEAAQTQHLRCAGLQRPAHPPRGREGGEQEGGGCKVAGSPALHGGRDESRTRGGGVVKVPAGCRRATCNVKTSCCRRASLVIVYRVKRAAEEITSDFLKNTCHTHTCCSRALPCTRAGAWPCERSASPDGDWDSFSAGALQCAALLRVHQYA